MTKPLIIADMKYKRKGETKSLYHLLKYLQYREGSLRRELYNRGEGYPADLRDPSRPLSVRSHWIDRGMGRTYSEIHAQAREWSGRSVLARSWVLSPDPTVMAWLPEDKREGFMKRVTERTIEHWSSDNNWGAIEYSYVLHDKHRAEDGQQMMHAHVIMPGTVRIDDSLDDARIDHYIKRPHLIDIQHTANGMMLEELTRSLGKERAQTLLREREETLEKEWQREAKRRRQFYDLKSLSMLENIAGSPPGRVRPGAEIAFYQRYLSEEAREERHRAWAEKRRERENSHKLELAEARESQVERMDRLSARRHQLHLEEEALRDAQMEKIRKDQERER